MLHFMRKLCRRKEIAGIPSLPEMNSDRRREREMSLMNLNVLRCRQEYERRWDGGSRGIPSKRIPRDDETNPED